MIWILILLAGLVMASRRAETINLVEFKEDVDLGRWLAGDGPGIVRAWILTFNEISQKIAGRPAVVTSWYRDDGTYHEDGGAVDFRRLSAANELDAQPYTVNEVLAIEDLARAAGLPIVRSSSGDHWHIGETA